MTPIRYIPQAIPNEFGNYALQQLQTRQNQYDTAFSGLMSAEDQFGQFEVDPSDIAGKNAVLGAFKDRTKEIIDRYGGDYAAASKDLAREVTKVRSNPFFSLAKYKQSLAEEERRRIQQLGPNAIILKSVSNTPVIGPNGQVVSKEDLQSNILDKRMIEQDLMTKYAPLANQVREEQVRSTIPGYYNMRTYKGLKQEELAAKTQEAFEYLKQANPDVPEEILASIAQTSIPGLSGGYQDQQIQDRNFMSPTEAVQYQAARLTLAEKQNELKRREDNMRRYGTPDAPAAPKPITDFFSFEPTTVAKGVKPGYAKDVKAFNEAAKGYTDAAKTIRKAKVEIARIKEQLASPQTAPGTLMSLGVKLASANTALTDARKKYARFEQSFGDPDVIKSYMEQGMTKLQAINMMAKQLNSQNKASDTFMFSRKADISESVNDLAAYQGEYYTTNMQGETTTGTGNLYSKLAGQNTKVLGVGFDMNAGTRVFKIAYGKDDKAVEYVSVPMGETVGNEVARQHAKRYADINNVFSGARGVGNFIKTLDAKGNEVIKRYSDAEIANVQPGTTVIKVAYDKATGKIKSNAYVQGYDMQPIYGDEYGNPYNLEYFRNEAAKQIEQQFGANTQQKQSTTNGAKNDYYGRSY